MENTSAILQQIKDSVKATYPGATIILFGSYARGDFREDSVIDILVLIDHDKETFEDDKKVGYPIYHISLNYDVLITPMVFSRN